MKFLKQWRFCATTAGDINPLTHCPKMVRHTIKRFLKFFLVLLKKKNEYEMDLWVS